jgi:hypothetical protein
MATELHPVRLFDTGATRDAEDGKYDYEGFLSPLVVEAYGRYMHKHRQQPDGKLRSADNWQKGIPKTAYIKSMFRHFVDFWKLHRGHAVTDTHGNTVTFEDALCAITFNAMGYLHETLKDKQTKGEKP